MKEQKPYYPLLEAELARRGIAKKEIAQKLGITTRSFSNKITGNVDFWLREVLMIHSLFPDIPVDMLFSHS